MKYLILNDLNSFQCIGSTCSYTCCADWKITIDDEAMKLYNSIDGKFGQTLQESISSDGKVNFFKLINSRCPFLNDDSLCDIYINLGEENMCTTCKTYPRKNWTYGDLTFISKYISCPEVARILFCAPTPLQYDFAEDTSIPDRQTDWQLFNLYVKGMTTSIDILQNTKLNFSARMRTLLLFNFYFQKHLDTDKNCNEIFDMFSDTNSIIELTQNINQISTNYNSRINLFLIIANNISAIADNTPILNYLDIGLSALNASNVDNTYFEKISYQSNGCTDITHIYENYGVYYLSMYYMDFMKNKSPYNCIIQFFTLFYLQNCFVTFESNKKNTPLTLSDIIEIYTKTARVYEHSPGNKNFNTTFDILNKQGMTSLPFLLSLT